MTPLFGEGDPLEEPVRSQLLVHAATARPLADGIAFLPSAAESPIGRWHAATPTTT